jgi:hypothetical protein
MAVQRLPKFPTLPPRSTQILLVCGFLLLGACWIGCSESPSPHKAIPANDQARKGPVIEDLVASIYDDAKLQFKINSAHAVLDLDLMQVFLTNVTVAFYRDGQWAGNLSSNEGTMFLSDIPDRRIAKNDFILLGKVLYKGKDGSTVSVPRLRYSAKESLLISGGGPFLQRIMTKDSVMVSTGSWFTANQDMTEFNNYGGSLKVENIQPTGASK